jgi:hypothetical protein
MRFLLISAACLCLCSAKPQPEKGAREVDPEYAGINGDIDGDPDYVMSPLNAIINPARCWPDGIIYYTIDESFFTEEEVQLIQLGIEDLVESTKVDGEQCIDILPWTDQTDYVELWDNGGCSSSVGRIGGMQRLSLTSTCVNRHGTIMHEFLHAFGFYHEQSRSDRDDWIIVNYDNIQEGKEHNFRKYEEDEIDLAGTGYDYESVMHYSPYGFAIDPEVPTIITIDPDAMDIIGQRLRLSDFDIERVQVIYGCKEPSETKYHRHMTGKPMTVCSGSSL